MNLRNPWFTYFSDEELSMIASHLAAGGAFCCTHNALWRATVTRSERKQQILNEHAYENWGCWDDSVDFASQSGLNAEYDLTRAQRYLEKFEGDISGQRYWP